MREFKFIGCRRSGNHAIIEWALNHFSSATLENDVPKSWDGRSRKSQSIIFKNDARDPLDEASAISWEDQDIIVPDQIIILRSAYNVAASRIASPKHTRIGSRKIERFLRIWPNHARHLLMRPLDNIVYDDWLGDNGYQAAGILDLPEPHLPLPDWKPKRGKQTTFTTENNKDRLTRFKTIFENVDPCLFESVLENDEIRELNWRIFGWTLNRSGELLS